MDLETLQNLPSWQWPEEDARNTIRKILIDRQASESGRLTAAQLAGDIIVMNDELAVILLAIVHANDEPEELRGRSAISLGPVLEEASTEEIAGELGDAEDVAVSAQMYKEIEDSLHNLFTDRTIPQYVRRRILEASVRAPEDWHASAIRDAYASGDRDWMLTAVFAMGYIQGFDDQILEALDSTDPDIHYEAVRSAGHWELDAAWPHVVKLVENPATPKPLLLAAIEAVGSIRPKEAGAVLVDLGDSDDEEIADAADEAMGLPPRDFDEEDSEDGSEEEDEEEDEEENDDGENEDEGDEGDWVN